MNEQDLIKIVIYTTLFLATCIRAGQLNIIIKNLEYMGLIIAKV